MQCSQRIQRSQTKLTTLSFYCAYFVQVTEADLHKAFSLNANSVALGFKYQLAAIEKSGGNGSIVVNTSVAASYVSTLPLFAGNGIYAASKSAADTITKYAVRGYTIDNVSIDIILSSAVAYLTSRSRSTQTWLLFATAALSCRALSSAHTMLMHLCM
jgi:NAD(P)-dependent dehydrogenase (short-subunit alcohol dehydrogenase family)